LVNGSDLIRPGEVWLVGAGPGDPDLLTRRAEKLLAAAEVVFYDALVGQDVLQFARGAAQIFVGKRAGRHFADQGRINQLLLSAANDRKRVVRLKGGDPSIFGRSLEEAAFLHARGVAVHICPGVTAASAAVASAGAALTSRGIARSVQFVTGRCAGEESDDDWIRSASPDTTIAVYMGRKDAPELASKLMARGFDALTPALVGVNVSLPDERLLRTTLQSLTLSTACLSDDEAVVVVIGPAAAATSIAHGPAFTATCEWRLVS
jgi:uroporphyrin-III C-methyltransferase